MRTFTTAGMAMALIVLLAAPARADDVAGRHGSYQIGAGDVLDIIVWRNKELTITVTVRPDGWISFPLANEVRVAGLKPVELQKTLEQALVTFVSAPMVTVIVTKVAPFKVSILGKVRQPGRYEVDAGTTVLDVLALASGPNDYADTAGMIYVLRRLNLDENRYERIPVKYSSSMIPGKDNANVTVKSGDIIMVP